MIFKATTRVAGSSVNFIPNFPHTVSSASDICRTTSGSNAWPERNPRIGMPLGYSRLAELCEDRPPRWLRRRIWFKWTFSKPTDDAWVDWCNSRDQIGQKQSEFNRANMTEELAPRLLALKKL